MGDSWRPGDGGGGDGRGRYQHEEYERNRRPHHYEPYPPPQRHYDSRPPGGGSSYHPPGPPPSLGQSRDSDRMGFTFRGAAGGQSHRPEQNFTFDAPGPRAPNGFGPDAARGTHERPRRFDRDGGRPRHDGRARGSGAPRGRGRGRGFGPKPANDRDILSAMAGTREPTPEQFEGMDDGQARFKDIVESSEESSDDDAPRKRTKVEPTNAPAAPKWSNPDPYTALPPPETLGAPKKDIVQVIRRAKNEQATKVDKVADNADFISFNFDDEGDAEMDPPSPPVTKSPANSGEPTFSHRDSFHRKTATAAASQPQSTPSSSFTPINQRSEASQRSKAPVSISSDSEPEIVAERVSRPPKRKSRDTRQLGDVTEEWHAIDGQPIAPWCTQDHSAIANVGVRLHREICDFFEYVKPRPFEETARLDLVVRIQAAIRAWGGANGHAKSAEVHCFGSFASGLYLPTADMDLVVLSKSFASGGPRQIGQSINQLRQLTQHIDRLGIAKPNSVNFIGKSKVPIVKFIDKRTGIKVDISFENNSGFPALETFKEWKEKYPAMPVLVALVKQFLVMRNINEVFCGGIGGFTTICLVTHILQTMPEIQSGALDPEQNYGEVFMKFLDFYGNKIDIRSAGILMSYPYHYDKDKHPRNMQNKDRLTIIDPNNPDNDISGGSHKIDTVFGRFRNAYSDLQRHMHQLNQGQISATSILECILGGNYESVDSQRERLRHLYGGGPPSAAPALPPAPAIPPGAKDLPTFSGRRANKKAKLREAQAATAQGQYAPSSQNAAPPVSLDPKYVAPMANVPLRSGGGGGSNSSPPFFNSFSSYHSYPPPIPQQRRNRFIPPPPDYAPPPSPSPPPPPPTPPPPPSPPANEPSDTKAPSSPDSSVSMDLSD